MDELDGRKTRKTDAAGKFVAGSRFGPPLSFRLPLEVDDRLRELLGIQGENTKETRAVLRLWAIDAIKARLDSEQQQESEAGRGLGGDGDGADAGEVGDG